MTRSLRSALPLLLALLLLLPAGCGKKGPVRPKQAAQPEAVGALILDQQGALLRLGWEIPTRNRDGAPAQDLVGFRIRRLAYAAADGCPTCRDPRELVAEIRLLSPDPAQRIGDRIYWRDLDVRPGQGYRYAVTPVVVGGHDGPAATIARAVVDPPAAPAELAAVSGNRQVRLSWTPPVLPEGAELLGYNLYRRQGERPFPARPLNDTPLAETTLTDGGVDNDSSYSYRVSALLRLAGARLESRFSAPAAATPAAGP